MLELRGRDARERRVWLTLDNVRWGESGRISPSTAPVQSQRGARSRIPSAIRLTDNSNSVEGSGIGVITVGAVTTTR